MYRAMKAKADIRTASQALASRAGQKELLEKQLNDAESRLSIAQHQLGQFDKVQILLQETSEFARKQSKGRIEEIVNSALAVVFGEPYDFQIRLDVRAGQPVADYYLQRGEVVTQLKPPDYDNGGGIIDVICLALKVAIGELSGIKGPLLFDEIGKHVSQEYAPNVAYFLKEYSDKFRRQIILVTHNVHLAEAGDVAIAVSERDGKSIVQAI